MNLILFMVAVTLFISGTFVVFYLWAVSTKQFEDLDTPAYRILKDDYKNDKRK